MYRCAACDAPAQMGCLSQCPSYEKALNKEPDLWGFKEDDEKLDIQSGVKVKVIDQQKEYA